MRSKMLKSKQQRHNRSKKHKRGWYAVKLINSNRYGEAKKKIVVQLLVCQNRDSIYLKN